MDGFEKIMLGVIFLGLMLTLLILSCHLGDIVDALTLIADKLP